MKHYLRKIVPMVLGAVLSMGAVATATAADVSQTSVLTGKIVSVVAVGTAVREGDTLVRVQSLTGPIAAARATVDGVVKSVSVKTGDAVKPGQVVVVLSGN